MGIESYFVNAKLRANVSIKETIEIIADNKSLDVTPVRVKKSDLFLTDENYVINKIVKCTMINSNILSFQACFSCYEKSLLMIAEIILTIMNANISECFFYCDYQFDFSKCEKDQIVSMLNHQMHERYSYFQNNFTTQKFDVLPENFYNYYNRHRKNLKRE